MLGWGQQKGRDFWKLSTCHNYVGQWVGGVTLGQAAEVGSVQLWLAYHKSFAIIAKPGVLHSWPLTALSGALRCPLAISDLEGRAGREYLAF